MSPDRKLLAGGVAVALLAAGATGFGLAKFTSRQAPPPSSAAVKKAEGPASNVLVTDQARIAASGVQVQVVSVGGLSAEIVAQATVVAEPNGQAVLTARAAGAVARLTKRLGDPVKAGETLALVESREASQISAGRSTAAAKANLARKVLAREKSLYEQKVSPLQDYEAAQAQAQAADAEARSASAAVGAANVSRDGRYVMVVSPISGRITAMAASLGAYVQPETELFRVADPGKVQIEASVTAVDAQRIKPGDQAVIETGPGAIRTAVVRSVTPGVSEQTRSATVVLALTGGAGDVQPGQAVRARIVAGPAASSGIVIPEDAVQSVGGREVVFVRTARGFRVQPVVVGARSAGRVQIAEGLKARDAIAMKNAFLLKAELGKGEDEE